jgi:hypothetical protein
MGYYATRRNYKAHNFNNSTLTINGTHKAEGLDGFEVELDVDEVDVSLVADGTGLFVENPSQAGSFKIKMSEASATNAFLWDLVKSKAHFSLSFLDSAVPDLDCNGQQCRIAKRPKIERGKDPAIVEWTCKAVYLDCIGGSYSLESA